MELITMPPYVICNAIKLPSPVILQTKKPFVIGKIYHYKSLSIMNTFLMKVDTIAYAIVPGYNICIQFAGTLDRHLIGVAMGIVPQTEAIMKEMAEFFIQEKINQNRKYYDQQFLQRKHQ